MNEPDVTDRGSLFDQIGGREAVDRLVDAFYERVFADPELAPFFRSADRARLVRMQQLFFTVALGGPDEYTGRPVATAHEGRGIRRRHFARFVECLLETMTEAGVDDAHANDIIARISAFGDDILGGHGLDG